MMTAYELRTSDDVNIIAGRIVDRIALETMKGLNLKGFRSCKNRGKDSQKAKKLYKDKVDMDLYAIHHCFNGVVRLVPREFHDHFHHNGYFYRLNN